jgi:hypothetical protein
MLQAWTGLDPHQLIGSNINSPENAIFMNDLDHNQFGDFFFYFDKDEVRNYYIAVSGFHTVPSIQIPPISTKCRWLESAS